MFTGIVSAIGSIEQVEDRGDRHVRIACPYDPADIAIGASIACAGVCLTVTGKGGATGRSWFDADVSAETVSRTAQDMWTGGTRLNLERSLRLGDEMGGHIVSGHIDAVGRVVDQQPEGGSMRLVIEAPAPLASFLAAKGSVAIDGVSLTVNDVADQPGGTVHAHLNIIPHTAEMTTLGGLREGSEVNLEVDTVARYLQRMESLRAG